MIIYLSFIIYVKVYHEEDRKYLKDQRNKVCCGSYGLGSAVRNGERRPCNQQPDVIEVQSQKLVVVEKVQLLMLSLIMMNQEILQTIQNR